VTTFNKMNDDEDEEYICKLCTIMRHSHFTVSHIQTSVFHHIWHGCRLYFYRQKERKDGNMYKVNPSVVFFIQSCMHTNKIYCIRMSYNAHGTSRWL